MSLVRRQLWDAYATWTSRSRSWIKFSRASTWKQSCQQFTLSDDGADDNGHIMVKTPWTRKVIEYIRWRMKMNTVSIPGTENGKAFTLMNRSSSQEHQHYKHWMSTLNSSHLDERRLLSVAVGRLKGHQVLHTETLRSMMRKRRLLFFDAHDSLALAAWIWQSMHCNGTDSNPSSLSTNKS